MGERVAGCDESHRGFAAAELAGVGEDGHYGSINYVGSSTGSAWCHLSARRGSGFLYIGARGWTVAVEDRIAGDSRCCSCRASWRRRTRSGEWEDKHGLCSEAAVERWWLGRRRPRRNPLPTPACCQGRGLRRSRASEIPWSRGRLVHGSAMQRGPGSGRVACGSAACRRSARACKTCTLGAPRARTAPARRNASAL